MLSRRIAVRAAVAAMMGMLMLAKPHRVSAAMAMTTCQFCYDGSGACDDSAPDIWEICEDNCPNGAGTTCENGGGVCPVGWMYIDCDAHVS